MLRDGHLLALLSTLRIIESFPDTFISLLLNFHHSLIDTANSHHRDKPVFIWPVRR
jgi:hypothetical protein